MTSRRGLARQKNKNTALDSHGNADHADCADMRGFRFHHSLFVFTMCRKNFPAYLSCIRFYPLNPRLPRSHDARVVPENLSGVPTCLSLLAGGSTFSGMPHPEKARHHKCKTKQIFAETLPGDKASIAALFFTNHCNMKAPISVFRLTWCFHQAHGGASVYDWLPVVAYRNCT